MSLGGINGNAANSIDLAEFARKVDGAKYLDGDVKLVAGSTAGTWTLAKVNYGGAFARFLLGGERTEVTGNDQNKQVREAFLNAIGQRYGHASKEFRTAQSMMGDGVGDANDYKPLSRREIKRVLTKIGFVGPAAADEKEVGGEAGLRLSSRQFSGMVDQAKARALQRGTLSSSQNADLTRIQGNLIKDQNSNGQSFNPDLGFADIDCLETMLKDMGYGDVRLVDREAFSAEFKEFRQGAARALSGALDRLRQDPGLSQQERTALDGFARSIVKTKDDDEIGFQAFLKARKGIKGMLDRNSQKFAQARAFIDGQPYFSGAGNTFAGEFENRLLSVGASMNAKINEIRANVLTADECLAIGERVKQLKRDYAAGATAGSVGVLVSGGLDTKSIAMKLAADAKTGELSAPDDRRRTASAYASRRIHTASLATCQKLEALRVAEELNSVGGSRLDEVIKSKSGDAPDKSDAKEIKRCEKNDLLSDLILNEDPIEVENGQLTGGGRIGRVFYNHPEEFLGICMGVARGGNLPVEWGAVFEGDQRVKLKGLVKDICKEMGVVKTEHGQVNWTCGTLKEFQTKFYAHSQAVFKLISKAGVEDMIDASLSGKAQQAMDSAIRRLGLNENGASPRDRLLAMLIRQTFATQDRAALRSLFANGFRFSAQKDGAFDPVAALLGAGPLTHKLLQGVNTDGADANAKTILEGIRNKMPPIPERIVKAELLAMLAQQGEDVKGVTVGKVLGAASIGQAFKCTLTLADGRGGTVERECLVKVKRPNVGRQFDAEASVLRAGVNELMRSDSPDAKELNVTLIDTVQSIKQEMSFRDELRNVIRGVRTYGVDGDDVTSMIPLLKDGGEDAQNAFVNAVNDPDRPFDDRRIDEIIQTHCASNSEDILLYTLVKGETLSDAIERGQDKSKPAVGEQKNFGQQLAEKVYASVGALDFDKKTEEVVTAFKFEDVESKKVVDAYLAGIGTAINEAREHRLPGVENQAGTTYAEDMSEVGRNCDGVLKTIGKMTRGAFEGNPPFLHGDIHAGNIMRESGGALKLIDYGRGTTLTEKESAEFKKLLTSIANPNLENRYGQVMDAYYNILFERYQELCKKASLHPLQTDENDKAEIKLLENTLVTLTTAEKRNQFIQLCADNLTDGADAIGDLERFVTFLGNQGLAIPRSLGVCVDSFVKMHNTETGLQQKIKDFVKTEKLLRKQAVVGYVNGIIHQMRNAEGLSIDVRSKDPQPLFNGKFSVGSGSSGELAEHDLTVDRLQQEIGKLQEFLNELNRDDGAARVPDTREFDRNFWDLGDLIQDFDVEKDYFKKDDIAQEIQRKRQDDLNDVYSEESLATEKKMKIGMVNALIGVFEKIKLGLEAVEKGKDDPTGIFMTDEKIKDTLVFQNAGVQGMPKAKTMNDAIDQVLGINRVQG